MTIKFDRTSGARWAPFRRAAGVVLSTLLLVPCIASSAPPPPVGIKVMLQPWDPRTDNDAVKTVFDSSDAVSTGLSQAWSQSKATLVEAVKKGLGKPDLIASGVTLRDMDLTINEPQLRVDAGAGDVLKATLTLPNTTLVATASQPTPLGSYADPRCKVSFTLDVAVAIRVTDAPSRLLQTAFGPNDRIVTVRDFSADSENAVCGFVKLILSTLNIWQKLTNAINDPNLPQYRQLNDGLKRNLDSALASLNGRLAVPAQYVRLKVWPNSAKTTVLFGVRELPVPSIQSGIVDGRVTVGDLKGLPLPIERCDQLGYTAKVKTGPRVVLTPAGELGDAPMHAFSAQMTGGALSASGPTRLAQPGSRSGQSCQYALKGLFAGFPNFITFSIANQQRPNSHSLTPSLREVVDVVPQGWRFDEALHPLPNVGGRDISLVAQMHGSPGYDARQQAVGRYNPGDPIQASIGALRTQPGVTQTNPGAAQIGIAQAAKAPTSSIGASQSTVASALRVQQAVNTSTPQWGGASLISRNTAAAVNQPTQASTAVTSPLKAPASAFIR